MKAELLEHIRIAPAFDVVPLCLAETLRPPLCNFRLSERCAKPVEGNDNIIGELVQLSNRLFRHEREERANCMQLQTGNDDR
ncbi:hypothetical protein D3C80_1871590 [compost metagenome]